jgi:PQQ-like domain
VAITFDTTPIQETTSSSTGTFTTRFQVPQGASIGRHTVTATGQSSGSTASAPFQVLPAHWPLFGFDARQSRFNPYENILNTSNVSSLTEAWSFATGSTVYSSPAVVNGVVYAGSDDHNVYAFSLPWADEEKSSQRSGRGEHSSWSLASWPIFVLVGFWLSLRRPFPFHTLAADISSFAEVEVPWSVFTGGLTAFWMVPIAKDNENFSEHSSSMYFWVDRLGDFKFFNSRRKSQVLLGR